MYRYILAFSYYNSIVKPITIASAINGVYMGGQINAMDDIFNGHNKPIYVNLFQIAKYATSGALIGFAFPITTPMTFVYIFYNQ